MRLASLELLQFRCWEALTVTFPEGRSTLVGPNGSGKTSVVEGAWYAASLGSHRTSTDAALIRRGADAAIVRAVAEREGRSEKVELEIRSSGRARAKRGGAPVTRRRDVLGAVRAQIFAPERQAVVRGEPSDRRKLMDELLTQLAPRFHGVMRDYERALRQRNALLKESLATGRAPRGLEAWDEALVSAGAEICAGRASVVARLSPHAARVFGAVGGEGTLAVGYEPNVPPPAVATGEGAVGSWAESMRARLLERRRDEQVRGVSLVGPHRDDLSLAIDGLPSRTHASFGEGWLVAISLIVGGHAALAEALGEEPVLLLDDPFTPLDPARRELLAGVLSPTAQVIVTAADVIEVPKQLGGTLLHVSEAGVAPA